MAGPLSHLKIVELCEDLPGSYCAKQFASWGASVFSAEPVGDFDIRITEPMINGPDGNTISCLREFLNANKETFDIDLANDSSLSQFRSLLIDADVFITDYRPERLREIDLDFESLGASNPQLVMLSLTPFGNDGPYSDYQGTDLILQALSGFMSPNGLAGEEVLKASANIIPYACGVNAFVGAMAAIIARNTSDEGQLIEVALIEAVASLVPFLRTEYSGNAAFRQGAQASGAVIFPCRDGHVAFSPHSENAWKQLLAVLNIEDDSIPDELSTPEGRQDLANMRAFFTKHTLQRSAVELFHIFNEAGITCGLAMSPSELLKDAHLESIDYFSEVDHPSLGEVAFPGPPAHMSKTPAESPILSSKIKAFNDKASKNDVSQSSESHNRNAPLNGVNIVDLTQAWLGPYATMLLADLGADIVKIENPKRPDVWRGWGVSPGRSPARTVWSSHPTNPNAHPWNTNANHNSVNRNKRSVALSLTNQSGKELFLNLVSNSDLVMENFRPHVMDRFGLGYDQLREVKSDIVMVSFSGCGETGPYQDYRANGGSTEATGGWCSLLGYTDGPPMEMGAMYADPIIGLQMAASALVALTHRNNTGEGQYVTGSMFETAVGYIGEEIMLASANGQKAERRGNRHRQMAPHGAFLCNGDDQWVTIAVRNDTEWVALLSVLPDSDLHDERYSTLEGRLESVDALEDLLRQWTLTRDAHEVMSLLQGVGVPAGVVQRTTEVPLDAHFIARDWFKPIEHPDMGSHRYNGFPWRFSKSKLQINLRPPRVGEHSAEVLQDVLNVSSDEYASLVEQNVTGSVLGIAP